MLARPLVRCPPSMTGDEEDTVVAASSLLLLLLLTMLLRSRWPPSPATAPAPLGPPSFRLPIPRQVLSDALPSPHRPPTPVADEGVHGGPELVGSPPSRRPLVAAVSNPPPPPPPPPLVGRP
ncbi:unnamed protein product [Ectocarpus sp. 8 AP-2014]